MYGHFDFQTIIDALAFTGAQVKTVYQYDIEDGEFINSSVEDLPDEVALMNPGPFRLGMYIGVSFKFIRQKE